MDDASVAQVVRSVLIGFKLASTYVNEQRDLQLPLADKIRASLNQSFPDEHLEVTASIDGANKPRVELLGTSFWPDIEIKVGEARLAAIEVKIVRQRQSASKALAEAIGQGVVYSLCYPRVFVFVVDNGLSKDILHGEDVSLEKVLSRLDIELILRRERGK